MTFAELHAARGSSGFGPSPITWLDLHAWSSLNRQRLEGWEVRAIRAMDAAYLASVAEQQAKG